MQRELQCVLQEMRTLRLGLEQTLPTCLRQQWFPISPTIQAVRGELARSDCWCKQPFVSVKQFQKCLRSPRPGWVVLLQSAPDPTCLFPRAKLFAKPTRLQHLAVLVQNALLKAQHPPGLSHHLPHLPASLNWGLLDPELLSILPLRTLVHPFLPLEVALFSLLLCISLSRQNLSGVLWSSSVADSWTELAATAQPCRHGQVTRSDWDLTWSMDQLSNYRRWRGVVCPILFS